MTTQLRDYIGISLDELGKMRQITGTPAEIRTQKFQNTGHRVLRHSVFPNGMVPVLKEQRMI
jgi:hypothetical protein